MTAHFGTVKRFSALLMPYLLLYTMMGVQARLPAVQICVKMRIPSFAPYFARRMTVA
jgi:hypothetical protein